MKYDIDIYEGDETIKRFLLGVKGNKPLYVIGVNPSTADDRKPDRTISKVRGFESRYGYNGFVMLNLYAQRTPYPHTLHNELDLNLHEENMKHILSKIKSEQEVSILAAWGEPILVRSYLKEHLHDLVIKTDGFNIKWLKIGELTKSGHPRHPSRAPYAFGLTDFDIKSYLKTL